tara:strand:+ start:1126 stop:1287 length:162 start_codon:yes stop_codon:yes gene_type:complete
MPQHQVLVNQAILVKLEAQIALLKSDMEEIKQAILYIKKYTEIKKSREDAKWF